MVGAEKIKSHYPYSEKTYRWKLPIKEAIRKFIELKINPHH